MLDREGLGAPPESSPADRAVSHSEYAIITEAVMHRPRRPPDWEAESHTLHSLARLMAGEPTRLLDGLVHAAIALCGRSADMCTAGVSLLEPVASGGEQFRWVTLAGVLAPFTGGTTRRDFSPCGVCLDLGEPVLYSRPDLHFDDLRAAGVPIIEGLVVPFFAEEGEPPVGTIWVVSHPGGRAFDAEDVRIVTGLAAFTGAAFRLSRTRDDAMRANRAKSDFLAAMSHELRTPLNAITGYAELMDLGVAGPVTTGQQEYLGRIRKSGQFLLGLINDVLNFARLDAGAVEVTLRPVQIRGVLATVHMMVEPQLRTKGIAFAMDECDPTWHVLADEEKVEQVLLNLLTNAIKFTNSGGTIAISCRHDDNTVRIAISDTGRGIAQEQLPSIFEPFVQVSRTLTPSSQQGIGLGLPISRTLARSMNGDLIAESELGVGSVFTLVLPASE